MYSIGDLSRRTGVKVPTIRYYESAGILAAPDRTDGNQRRYDSAGLERLAFIKHARDLGFSLEAIAALIQLREAPDRSCASATEIAQAQLAGVRRKIRQLRALETELVRIAKACDGAGATDDCQVLAALADHDLCETDHDADGGGGP